MRPNVAQVYSAANKTRESGLVRDSTTVEARLNTGREGSPQRGGGQRERKNAPSPFPPPYSLRHIPTPAIRRLLFPQNNASTRQRAAQLATHGLCGLSLDRGKREILVEIFGETTERRERERDRAMVTINDERRRRRGTRAPRGLKLFWN